MPAHTFGETTQCLLGSCQDITSSGLQAGQNKVSADVLMPTAGSALSQVHIKARSSTFISGCAASMRFHMSGCEPCLLWSLCSKAYTWYIPSLPAVLRPLHPDMPCLPAELLPCQTATHGLCVNIPPLPSHMMPRSLFALRLHLCVDLGRLNCLPLLVQDYGLLVGPKSWDPQITISINA